MVTLATFAKNQFVKKSVKMVADVLVPIDVLVFTGTLEDIVKSITEQDPVIGKAMPIFTLINSLDLIISG